MDITSVALGGVQPQQNAPRNSSAKLRSVVDALISNKSDQVLAQQTTASRLQAREVGFKQASGSLARVSTLAQTAGEGEKNIRVELEKLRTASGDDVKKSVETIDRIAKSTSFEGKPLLDGTHEKVSLEEALSGTAGGKDDITLSLPNLSAKALVGDTPSPEKIDEAIKTVDKAVADAGDFEKAVDVIAASIDTAAANQQAAQSDLKDTDLDSNALKDVKESPAKAVIAQGNQLNPALVKLVN
jgi:flagellin-like hook-associated protein FlgL